MSLVTATAASIPAATPLRRHLPNVITVGRLVVSAVFFLMLALYRYEPGKIDWWLFVAGWVYGVAAVSDVVDGYLARKWQVTSTFGRVVDPFCDKILILGTFAFLAGPPFIAEIDGQVVSLTGVGPVVVVLLLARELLVTTLRSIAESGGTAYAAQTAGKVKMLLQSLSVPIILATVVFRPILWDGGSLEMTTLVVRGIVIWGTVLATLVSGALYLPRRIRPDASKSGG